MTDKEHWYKNKKSQKYTTTVLMCNLQNIYTFFI